MKNVMYVASLRKSAGLRERAYDGARQRRRTGEQLDVEDVHGLVVPGWRVLAPARTRPAQVQERQDVPQNRV